MKSTWTTILVLFTLGAALGVAQESPERSRQRAESSSGGERARLFSELARHEMEIANQYFTDGNVEKAHQEVQDSIADAEKAADAAVSTGKRLKQTEIELRRLQRRTEDIRHSLNFEDRPALETVENKLEQLRRALLQKMFGDGKKS